MDGFLENAALGELKLSFFFVVFGFLPLSKMWYLASECRVTFTISVSCLNFSFKVSLFCSTGEPQFCNKFKTLE